MRGLRGCRLSTVTSSCLDLAVEQDEDAFEDLFDVDGDGRFGFAVEAEHGAADLGHAGEFLLGEVEIVAAGLRGLSRPS